jgi:hypothetical protein
VETEHFQHFDVALRGEKHILAVSAIARASGWKVSS